MNHETPEPLNLIEKKIFYHCGHLVRYETGIEAARELETLVCAHQTKCPTCRERDLADYLNDLRTPKKGSPIEEESSSQEDEEDEQDVAAAMEAIRQMQANGETFIPLEEALRSLDVIKE